MRWCARRLAFSAPTLGAFLSGRLATSTSPTPTSAASRCSRRHSTAASSPRTRFSPHSTEGSTADGARPTLDPASPASSVSLIVPFPRLAPFIRSTAAVLFRQNRIRGILAATAALALLLSPYRSDRAL